MNDVLQNKRVLFLTHSKEDYLADCTLIGLRGLLGANCVDAPRKECMYSSCDVRSDKLYGNGFTVWKLLEEIDVNRDNNFERAAGGYFDVIVLGNVRRMPDAFSKYKPLIRKFPQRFVYLDGEDSAGWQRLQWMGLVSPYFKRERSGRSLVFSHPISFSIPEQKILPPVEKDRLFATHVQCDVAYNIPYVRENCRRSYAFSDESMYRLDLRRSKYGITMKKSGWDCMRHYEIAGSGTVPAFFDLAGKPAGCAPHGLVDMVNCVSFTSSGELMEKIDTIDRQSLYTDMQNRSIEWARNYSSQAVAARLLRQALAFQTVNRRWLQHLMRAFL